MTSPASADQILRLERGALDRWGKGDPGGFLELYATDITYFDPVTATRIDGHQAMEKYYRPWAGKIHIARYEMVNPQVVVEGNLALLTYNLVNYLQDPQGAESVGSCWNSTTVYQHRGSTWKAIDSHWFLHPPSCLSEPVARGVRATGGVRPRARG